MIPLSKLMTHDKDKQYELLLLAINQRLLENEQEMNRIKERVAELEKKAGDEQNG